MDCVNWLEVEESVDAQNQRIDDLRNITLELEQGELCLAAWLNHLRNTDGN